MSTKKLMAEYIFDNVVECCNVCTNLEKCNAATKLNIWEQPPKDECLFGLINYFEKQSFLERKKNGNK